MNSVRMLMIAVLAALAMPRMAAAQEEKPAVKTKTFSVGKGGLLDLSVDGGDVRIIPSEKGEVTIHAYAPEEEDLEDLSMTQRGSTVRVENLSGGGWGNIRYEVTVPSQFDLDLRTASGMISIEGPLSGKINGTTSGGDIRLGDITGPVDMTTSGGDIKAGKMKGDLELKTSGGDIRVGAVDGMVDVNTAGGDIHMENVTKSLQAKTSGGDIVVGNVGGEANVSTSGGNVTLGTVSGAVAMSTAGGDIELEGATGSVKAKTAGGNILLANISGSVDARTAGGEVQAELLSSGNAPSRLSTASGEIRLTLAENVKATITARIRVEGRWRSSRNDYRVRSDFPAQTSEKSEEDREIRATYQINGGGEAITLETVNADITILKSLRGSK